MASFYDEIEIEDFDFDQEARLYTYPCPCGDKFQITEEELYDGEEVARCPSCSLIIRVIYNRDNYTREDEEVISFGTTALMVN